MMAAKPSMLVALGAVATLCLAGAGSAQAKLIDAKVSVTPGTVSLVDQTPDGAVPNQDSLYSSASADGRYVAYTSYADDIVPGDTNGVSDVFLYDSQTGATIAVGDGGYQPDLSANGTYLTMEGSFDSPGLPDGGIVRYNVATDVIEPVSLSPAGAPPNANGWTIDPSISASGRFVVYTARAHNLVPGDHNHLPDALLWDAQTGETTLASRTATGEQTDKSSYASDVSRSGRYVVFLTDARNMGPSDTNRLTDVYLFDTTTGAVTLVSHDPAGMAAGGIDAQISDNGRWVTFESESGAFAPGDDKGLYDIFSYNVSSGAVKRVSVEHPKWAEGAWNLDPTISATGRYLSYGVTKAPITADSISQVYLFDRATGSTTRLTGAGAELPYGYAADIASDDVVLIQSGNTSSGHTYLWRRG